LAQRQELVIASGNPHKVREIGAMLDAVDLTVLAQPDGLEIEETGDSFTANARLKAETVARLTGRWTLADDSGLVVDALGGAPGLFSARYAASDAERIARLLQELGDTPYRSAAFHSALALADPGGHTRLEAEGICRGEILLRPVEVAGSYGYNTIFHVRGAGCTYAEMGDHLLNKFGSRAKAARAMAPKLRALLGIGALSG
jgi:non-canonical purine NTP pyrophosphatase (RdgB/HAM1 family)